MHIIILAHLEDLTHRQKNKTHSWREGGERLQEMMLGALLRRQGMKRRSSPNTVEEGILIVCLGSLNKDILWHAARLQLSWVLLCDGLFSSAFWLLVYTISFSKRASVSVFEITVSLWHQADSPACTEMEIYLPLLPSASASVGQPGKLAVDARFPLHGCPSVWRLN